MSKMRALTLLGGMLLVLRAPVCATTPTNVQFTRVSSSVVNLSWTLDSPTAESPLVVLSTAANFSVTFASATGAVGLQTTSYVITDNTTYYFEVKVATEPDANYSAAIGTITLSRFPIDIIFDNISTSAVTASAYAATPGFTNLNLGSSGIDVAVDGAYAAYHVGGNTWTYRAAMSLDRTQFAAVVLGGKIYAMGGTSASVPATTGKETESYDPVTNAWTSQASMPTPRYSLCAAAANGKIYAIGGLGINGGGNLSTNEEYDPVANTWAAKAPMLTARNALACAAVGSKIYALGGSNGLPLSTNEQYDSASNTWSAKSSMPTALIELAAASARGKVYAVGGYDGSSVRSLNEEYNPGTDSWQAKATMQTARRRLAAAVVGAKIYAVGGFNGAYLSNNEEYDPSADQWATRAPLNTARQYPSVAEVFGIVYALGGSVPGADLNINESFDPGVAATFSGLQPNSLHGFKAKSRNSVGTEGAESPVVSTYTLAAIGLPAGAVFTNLTATSFTVNYSTGTSGGGYNPLGTQYFVEIATSADYYPITAASMTANASADFLLGINTSVNIYFARVTAYNSANVGNLLNLGSLAVPPAAPIGVSTFSNLSSFGFSVNWASGTAGTGFNPPGTRYRLQVSTVPSFTLIATSSDTGNLFATVSVQDNSTYYAQVAVLSDVYAATAFTNLGSTFTPVATPTNIIFDEVYATTITASGYASTPGFSNLDQGLSGINIALNGAYAGYRAANSWTSKTSLPTARYYLAVAANGGLLYALGGTPDGATKLNTNEAYDPVTNSWSSKASAGFTARYGLAAVAVGGKVYAIGGNTGVFSGINEAYDPVSNSWSSKSSMLTSRQFLAAASVNNKIYAIGGYNGGSGLGTNEIYDPITDSWGSQTAMPTGRSALAVAAVGGKIYALGGLGPLSNNETYDPSANAWTIKTNLPTGRQYLAAAALGGKIYVLGGSNPTVLNTNEEYDAAVDSWAARSPMITARYGLGAAQAGNKIYAIGGNGGSNNANEAFDSGDAVQFTGLTPNTLYTFKAKARGTFGAETAELTGISTYTLSVIPAVPSASTFTNISASSLRVNWSSGSPATGYNAAGVQYVVQLSTNSNFASVLASSITANLYATFGSLSPDSTSYYSRVAALNQANAQTDWLNLGGIGAGTLQMTISQITGTTGSTTNGIAWGDFNNDGLLDLAIGNDGNHSALILKNNGDGTFTKTVLASTAARGVAWGDYNNDGYLDLAIARSINNPVIARNNGDGTFTLVPLTATSGDGVGIAWGDFNNDGLLDLIVAYTGGQDPVIMYNNGDGTFTKSTLTGASAGVNVIGVSLADYNNDGYLDIALGVYGNNQILLKNNGDGTFTKTALAGSTSNADGVAWGDYNGDGWQDLAVTNDSGDSFVMRNNGDGTFTKVGLTGSGGSGANTVIGVAWGDFNNDGLPDVALSNSAGNSMIMRNNGDGTFTRTYISSSAITNSGITAGDYNNDGALDLAVGNNDAISAAELLRNDFASAHTAPTAPNSGFSATFHEYAVFSTSGVLTLNWSDGADSKMATPSLNYLVRIGTSTGKGQVLGLPKKYSTDGYSGGGSYLYSTRLSSSQRGLRIVMQKETTAYWGITTENAEKARSAESSEQSIMLVAPAAVSNLSASQDSVLTTSSAAWVDLAFTSPGENGTSGALQAGAVYDVRWATFPLTSQIAYLNANYQQIIAANGPASSGVSLSISVVPGRTYYFALTTKNSSGVRSPLSNSPSAGANGLQYLVTSLNPGTYLEGQTTAYLMLQMWTDSGSLQWRSLKVGKIGTVPDNAVQVVSIWRDANSDGVLETAGPDFQTSANTVFSSSQATISLLGGSGEVINTSTKTYFVAVGLQSNYLPVDGSTIAIYLSGMAFSVSSGGVRSPDYPALTFNTANRVFLAFNGNLNQTTGLTVEAWARSTMTYSGTNINVLDRSGGNYATGYNLSMERTVCPTPGAPAFDTGGSNTICSPFLINDGRWHHIAGTYDSVKGRLFFVDGLLVSTAIAAGSLNDVVDGLAVGGAIGSGTGLTGDVDEVRISTFARYAQSFIPQRRFTADGGTVVLYHFDISVATSNIAADSSGNGLNGSIQSGTIVSGLSGTATAKQLGTILVSSVTDISPPVFTRGGTNASVLKLQLWTPSDFVTLNRIIVERTGSAGDASVSAVRILLDNGNGVFEPGVDSQLTSDQVFSGGVATFNFVSAGTAQLIGPTTQVYWIAMDVAPGAISGTTLALKFSTTADFLLSGTVSTISASGFPVASSTRSIVAAFTNVTASVATGTWVNVSTIAFNGGFAKDNVDHYFYVFNQLAVTNITGTETIWSSGTLAITPAADANNWYFHVRGYDASGSSGTQADLGSFWFDRAAPVSSGFVTVSSTFGFMSETQWNNLAFGATAQIAVQDVLSGLAVSTSVVTIAGDGHDNPALSGGFGVMLTTSAGQNWIDWSTYTTVANLSSAGATDLFAMAAFNGSLYAGSGSGGTGFIYSSPDGVNWSQVASGLDGTVQCMTAFNGKLYAGTNSGTTGKIYSSPDGVTWSLAYTATGEQMIYSLSVFDGKIYAGSNPNAKLYQSSDGIVWNQVFAAAGETYLRGLGVYNGRLYIGTYGNAKVYSTSDGVIFNFMSSFAGATTVDSLTPFNGRLFAGTGGNNVFVSTDAQNWTQVLSNAAGQIRSLTMFNGKLYAGAQESGRLYATADGNNWNVVLSKPAGETEIDSIAGFNGKLFVGTNSNAKVVQVAPLAAALTGADGTTASQTLSISNLSLVQSTNAVACAGVYPCGASDQIIFTGSDLAGNVRVAGPFAILVDSMTPLAISTPSIPGNGLFISTQPNFSWTGASTPTIAGMGAGAAYVLQVSSGDANFAGANIVVNISTPIAVNPSSTTADGLYISTYTLPQGATYYWHVRPRSGLGDLGPWSQTYSFVTDFSSPAALGFNSFSSTGGILAESQWNNLASPVTAQLQIRDVQSGLAQVSSAAYQVQYSTTAGVQWNLVTSTTPGAGSYLSLTGNPGSNAIETFKIFNLALAASANNVVCNGASGPCTATNQIFFTFSDRAGNSTTAGPYALLVDTFTPLSVSTPVFPANGSFVNATPNFNWIGPSTTTAAGIPGGAFLLQVSSSDPAFAQSNIVFSIAAPMVLQSTNALAVNGAYLSTATLNEGATYYWRIAQRSAFGDLGPWSQSNSFVTDYTNPAATAFVSLNSTGGAVGETQWNNVATNASAQMTVQDVLTGLAVSANSVAFGGDGHDNPGTTNGFGVIYSTTAAQSWIDGTWSSMGSPIAGETGILSMAAFNGKLYAGTRPNGKVAVFDGVSWSASNGNASLIPGETDILTLAVYNGKLYAGTAPNGKVAVFDGSSWTTSNGNASIIPGELQINALSVFNGKLYGGTSPSGKVAAFDGNNWVPTANNAPILPGESNIVALTVFNGKLYAGTAPGGKVTAFDGSSWVASNANTQIVAGESQIKSLAVYGQRLFAGTFPGAKIGIFDGFTWTTMGTIISGESSAASLAVFGGRLYAGTGNNAKAAIYDGTVWAAGNSGGPVTVGETIVNALAPFNGKLYAGTSATAKIVQLTPVSAAIGAADGAQSAQTLTASGLNLAPSLNVQSCGGGSPCSATDQIKFASLDRAGNAKNAGPFAVIVDSVPPTASVTSLTPTNTSIVATATGTDNMSGVRDFNFEASSSPAFSFSVSSSNFIAAANYAFNGLVQGTTYYVRVTSRDNAFNLSPTSVAIATSTIGAVFYSSANVAPANALQSTEVPFLRVTLQTPPGSNATFQSMVVRQTGSAADGDLTAVKIYLDGPGTGVFDPAQDIQLGAAAMSGGVAAVSLGGNAQSINSSGKNFFVVYQVNPQATIGNTLGARILSASDIGFSFPFAASGPFPTNSSIATIQDGANNLNITGVNTAPTTAPPGSTNIPLLKLIAQTSSGTSVLQSLQLHLSGNVPSNAITAVRVFRDANSNGVYDPGDALVSGGSDIFLNGVSTVNFTAIASSLTITPSQALYFVTYSLSGSASPGNTFGVQITSATDLIVSDVLDTVVFSATPISSALGTVAANNNVNVNVSPTVPTSYAQGTSYSVLEASATVDAGVAQLNRFQVNRLGAGVDADLTSAQVYLHSAADGMPWNPAVDVLLGSAPFSGGIAKVNITTTTLTAGTTSVFFVVYAVSPTATIGDTLGAGMTNSGYISAVSPFSTIFLNAPINSSTGPVAAGVSHLQIAALDQTSGGIAQGTANTPLLRLTVNSDFNPISWSALTVSRLGAGTDSDVKAVKIFLDANGNGVLDGGDTLVTSGSDKFVGGSAVLAFNSPQSITGSTQTYFLAADIDPNAIPNDSLGVSITTNSNFNLNSPNAVSSATAFPINAGPVAIQQFANTVTITTTSIAPAGANIGSANVGVLKLSLNTNVSQAQWISLRLDRGGSSSDSDVTAVKVYYDFNNLGTFNPLNASQYLLVSSTGVTFGSAGPGSVVLTISTAATLSSSPKTYFVAIDLSSAAVPGDTINARVLNAGYVTVNAPNSVAPTAFASNLMTVNAPASVMYLVAGSSAPANILEGTNSVAMLTLKTWMQSFTGQWSGLGITQSGSAADSDISRVSIYADDGNGAFDPLADTQLATGTFTNGFAQLGFPAQTISASTRTFFIVYNVSPIAVGGRTIGASVTSPGAVTLAAPNSVSNLTFPLASSLSVILPTQNGVSVVFQDKTPSSIVQGATSQVMLSLAMNTTSQAVVWNSINLQRNGTAADSDISAIHIYKDVNNNGVFDAGDQEITTGNDKFIGGAASVFLAAPQSITVTPARYFIALDANLFAISTASIGLTISSAAALGMSFPNYTINSGFPMVTTVIPFAKKTDTMLLSITDLTPPGVNQGAEVAMTKLSLSAQRDFVIWSQLQVGKIGNLADAFVTMVRIYKDSNGDGVFDAGDVLIGTGTVTAGQAFINLNAIQRLTTTPGTYFVTFAFDPSAPIGATVGFSVPNNSFGVLPPDVVSNAGLPAGGRLASMLDARTPTIPIVTLDGPYWNSFDSMHFQWSSAVGSGTIVNVQYAIGTTPGGVDALPFTNLPSLATTYLAMGIALQNSTTYYVTVKATSNLGFTSPPGISAPILVDFTVPSAPITMVTPGGNALLVTWSGSQAGLSGILGYVVEYRLGSSPEWINAKTNSTFIPFSYSLHSYSPVSVSTSQLVVGGSFSVTPPFGTVYIQVQAVSQSGVLGNPSAPPVRVLFGPLPQNGINQVSNYPNPFDSRKEKTTINYTLTGDSDITIKIFNIFGGKIKEMTFSAGGAGGMAGSNDVTWDGTDDGGRKVSKGMYIAVLQGGGAKVIQKIGVIH